MTGLNIFIHGRQIKNENGGDLLLYPVKSLARKGINESLSNLEGAALMIVKIDGKIVEVIETALPKLAEKNYKIIVPDLNEPATGLIDAVDKFNYGLFSKTETTEFLYRHMHGAAKFYFEGAEQVLTTFVKDGPIGIIELIF